MDAIRKITAENAPPAIGPYSQAIVVGDAVYLSGQLGIRPEDGKLVEGGVISETKQALETIKAVLLAAGSNLSKVVSVTVYLADMADFTKMNEIYSKYFKEPYPVRTTVGASKLPKNASIEISAVAVKNCK
jgi:2-iminobutanoate/2-iminopropanoate deaminase